MKKQRIVQLMTILLTSAKWSNSAEVPSENWLKNHGIGFQPVCQQDNLNINPGNTG